MVDVFYGSLVHGCPALVPLPLPPNCLFSAVSNSNFEVNEAAPTARRKPVSPCNPSPSISPLPPFPPINAMAEAPSNPLVSSKPSESGLTVSLHPLVLLTISDQVARQSLRKQKCPVAGAILGQQKGREITAEYAFPVALVRGPEERWQFDYEWMTTRIQQCKVFGLVCINT
jgi:hypothetical protein